MKELDAKFKAHAMAQAVEFLKASDKKNVEGLIEAAKAIAEYIHVDESELEVELIEKARKLEIREQLMILAEKELEIADRESVNALAKKEREA